MLHSCAPASAFVTRRLRCDLLCCSHSCRAYTGSIDADGAGRSALDLTLTNPCEHESKMVGVFIRLQYKGALASATAPLPSYVG